MRIDGAIFDCDGTLLDSMGMWADCTSWVFRSRGQEPAPGFFERVESLSLRDCCRIAHEECGFADSADALYEELCAHVREEYLKVGPMPGAEAFLRELAAAGVPMVIATSTPVREVRWALKAHGLEGYFADVVSTEDVGGRDKEFPDVYEEALRRLGTPKASTWVFEDAPFGVQTSHKAGFPVVGLMNDHDGRREEDVRPYCDIYAHGFAELSLALIKDYERAAATTGAKKTGDRPALRALVVDGSPEPSSPGLVARLAAEADYVIAVERGAEALLAAGVAPDVFVGDCDSASAEAATWARAHASTDIRFPAEKYATDLALALECAEHEAARRGAPLALTVTCASGGRPDHSLAVVGLLASAAAASAHMVEDSFELRVLKPEAEARWELGEGAVGKTFSAVALAPGTRIDESGMQWPLEDKPMELLGDLGISNVVRSPGAGVACRSGAVAAFLLQ